MSAETTDARDTRERILDAGEMMFADQGFAGASVRAVTAAAGTNLNAVNYHFGSKEGLFRAVGRRVMGPVNEEQLRLLTDLEAEQREAGRAPSAEELIGAYASPIVDLLERDEERGRRVSRLFARVLADASGGLDRAVLDEVEESEERYLRAFARALPHLPTEELWWRFQATRVVVAFHWVLFADGRPPETGEGFRGWMLPYLAAAMRAPSGAPSAASRGLSAPRTSHE